ncbi:hypothetical protein [Haladaptatus sp. DFWS20]
MLTDRHNLQNEEELATTIGLYRRSRPSASGLDPEGEGRTLR